jgi:hypothetical protein
LRHQDIHKIVDVFNSIFALFGKAASGGKQVKQGIRSNP